MSAEVISLAQLVSVIVGAFGAPGLTFWVMKKMSRETLHQIKENCKACRASIDEKIVKLDDELHDVVGRQIGLRERLPIDYVRRDEFLRHVNGKT